LSLQSHEKRSITCVALPDTEVPDHGLIAAFRRPTPYLLTPQQITALLHAAQPLGPPGALRPHTVSTVIGLLASTGLRIGEALRLMITDVRLEETPPHVHIRETKFRPRSWDRPLYAFRGGRRGAGASSTDATSAINIERGC
jgi:integrase